MLLKKMDVKYAETERFLAKFVNKIVREYVTIDSDGELQSALKVFHVFGGHNVFTDWNKQ